MAHDIGNDDSGTSQRVRTRWRWFALLFGCAIGVTLAVLIVRHRHQTNRLPSRPTHEVSTTLAPPTIDRTDVDPAVIQVVKRARQQVVKSPERGAAWGELAMVLHAHGFTLQAADCYAQAEKLEPQQARWPYLHARTLLSTDPQRAVELLKQATNLCGNRPPAPRLVLIETLIEQYQLEEARRQLDQLLAEIPNDERAQLAAARLAFLQGNIDTALGLLDTVLAQMKNDRRYAHATKPVELLRSECLRRLGKIDQAEAQRTSALKQKEPSWPDPYMDQVSDRKTGLKTFLVQADLLFGRQEYEKSIQLLDRLVHDYPESIWAKILLSRALIRTGAPDSRRPDAQARLARAEKLLQDVLKLDPNSVEAMFRLAVAANYQGKRQQAIDLYEQAVRIKPDFTMAHLNLAYCRLQEGNTAAATASLERAIAVEPDFAQGHEMLGWVYARSGNLTKAEEHLRTAVQLAPARQSSRRLLQQVLARKQTTEPAGAEDAVSSGLP